MDLLKILAVVGSVALLVVVVELIRRGRLKERYSLLWLLAGGILLFLSSSRGVLDSIARLLGIFYPPSFLFLLAFFFLLLITLQEQKMVKREIESTDRQIDALVYELYRLTPAGEER